MLTADLNPISFTRIQIISAFPRIAHGIVTRLNSIDADIVVIEAVKKYIRIAGRQIADPGIVNDFALRQGFEPVAIHGKESIAPPYHFVRAGPHVGKKLVRLRKNVAMDVGVSQLSIGAPVFFESVRSTPAV